MRVELNDNRMANVNGGRVIIENNEITFTALNGLRFSLACDEAAAAALVQEVLNGCRYVMEKMQDERVYNAFHEKRMLHSKLSGGVRISMPPYAPQVRLGLYHPIG